MPVASSGTAGPYAYPGFQAGAALLDAARLGLAPRVPVYAQMHEFVARQAGIPGKIFYTRPEIMVPAMLQVQAEYGLELAALTYDVYNIEAEGLGQKLLYSEANMPDIDRSQPLIRDSTDLHFIKTPHFETAGRFEQVVNMLALYRSLTGLAPSLSFCAPFTLAANLYGTERLLVAIYQEPRFARRLLDKVTEQVLLPWILYQKKHYPEVTKITGVDAIASLPIVNWSILQDWVYPYILRLQEMCGIDAQVVNWVGERLLKPPNQMLALKALAGSGTLQGQDPDVEALGPACYVNYAARHNLFLILGIGAGFLAHSQPGQIRERVRQYVESGKTHRRFALYLCNIDAETPPENLRAALCAVKEYGEYP
jgi:hypothetical protein